MGRIGTVYHLGKDARCCRLTDSARATEEVCMRQLTSQDRVLEGLRDVVLTDKCSK